MSTTLHLTRGLALLVFVVTAGPLAAHEFWIDTGTSVSVAGGSISADLRVGQELSGFALPYLDTTIRTMTHHAPTESLPVAARLGDRPAISGVSMRDDGLHILTVETNPSFIVFEDMTEFEKYLDYEGLLDVADLHRNRDLPETEIAEAYIRNARALVQVGSVGSGDVDRATGMPFEIVVEGTPFATGQETLTVQLRWQDAGAAGVQIALFHLKRGASAPEQTSRSITRTDKDGYAMFAMAGAGKYMLNAVRMDPVEGPGSVVWQSHWASITFELDPVQ